MGRSFKVLLNNYVYSCSECGNHLSDPSELVSTSFRGRTGPAWLFSKVINVCEGHYEDRMMTTGQHTIVDIYCNNCRNNVGWKYEDSSEESQKYKKGKYILEKALLSFLVIDQRGKEHEFELKSSDCDF
ncbi:zinc binding protein (Yippee), putative [Plasmodium ovale wallikeri]|uniref:Protein yippee-like n=3 Tax=Plasmodium ovale TaxID=36330 RepID=A0A1A8W2N5_PLAOA|nr:zinc binding protein (Yippee), putative [Plasmodium ovale curtisi]SBT33652.1 zinc binding protein (Yippee), putative [Plasmodium ovale wallikeri]SBT76448.1 zinc binding protein (Yippee), putative [Plasmodium ovale]SBS91431.1 zinc binding protein (Yippee), putative [Plasmodium ovale curtisi]SBT34081.1 zinc binding protein (Yippee), putative [Plasmodium ovale wallikeri]